MKKLCQNGQMVIFPPTKPHHYSNNRNKTVTEGGMTIQISDYDGANIIVASDATSDTCISTEFSFERQGPSPPSDSTGKRGRSPRARRVTLSPASARAIVSSVIEEDGKSNYEADNSVDISRSNYGAVNSDVGTFPIKRNFWRS